MAKYITQIRFYGNDDERNSPMDLTDGDLIYGRAFTNYSPIIQLGIQTSPTIEYTNEKGAKVIVRPSFYINGGAKSIQIGKTGIYELDLEGIGEIEQLTFNQDFINAIIKYNQQTGEGNAHVMIDLVYEG